MSGFDRFQPTSGSHASAPNPLPEPPVSVNRERLAANGACSDGKPHRAEPDLRLLAAGLWLYALSQRRRRTPSITSRAASPMASAAKMANMDFPDRRFSNPGVKRFGMAW